MARRRSNVSRAGVGVGRLLSSSLLLLPATTTTTLAQTTMHELVSTYRGGWIQDGVMFDVRTVTAIGNSTDPSDATPDGVTVFGMNVLTPLTSEFCVELYTKSGSFSSAASNKNAWTFLGSFALEGRGATLPTPIPAGAFDPVFVGTGKTQAFYVTTQNEKLRYTALRDGTVTGDVYASSEVQYVESSEEDVRVRGKGKGRGKGRGKGGRSGRAPRDKDDTDAERRALRASTAIDDMSEKYLPYVPSEVAVTGSAHEDEAGRALQGNEGLRLQILTGVAKNYPFAESWPHRVFNGALLYTLGQESSTGILSAEQIATAQATRRGLTTCDEAAMPPTPPPTVGPTKQKSPTKSPSESPTLKPSDGPTESPTLEPTTLESTIRKVATTLHGGLKQSGCMFDVRVPSVEDGGPPEGITVLAVEMSTFLREDICVEVYTKDGTYEGFEQDVVQNEDGTWSSPTWSIMGAATVRGRGEREPTHLPIGALDPVHIAAGQRRAFYVTMTEPEMRYTEPKYGEASGDLFSGSPLGHMELMVGAAVAYPFEEAWPDRIFNGAVVYALGDVPDSKYNEMGEVGRERSCPRHSDSPTEAPSSGPTEGPSKRPTKSPVTPAPVEVEVVVTSSPTVKPTPVPTVKPTPVPTVKPTPVPTVSVAVVATEAPVATVDAPEVVDGSASVTESTVASSTEATVATTPTESGGGDVVDVLDPVVPATTLPPPKPTMEPTFDIVTAIPTPAPSVDDRNIARLAGSCPSAASASVKDVQVGYEYTMLVAKGADAATIVEEMENVLHQDLMADMCTERRELSRGEARALQTVTYQGFTSDPDDYTLGDGCGEGVAVPEGQSCFLVKGGATAVVDESADEGVVRQDVASFAEGVLADPATYEELGIQQVAFESDGSAAGGGGGGQEGTGGGDQEGSGGGGVVGGANKDGNENTAPEQDEDRGLSTTGKIIIGVLAGILGLVIVALVAMRVRKKRKMRRSESQELFQEFPDEEDHTYGKEDNLYGNEDIYGNPPGLTQSTSSGYQAEGYVSAPMYSSSTSAPPPPSGPPPRAGSNAGSSSTRGTSNRAQDSSPAVILNELDDFSLVSNENSKSKFAPSVIARGRTGSSSGRSVGSGGSRGSRGSGGSGSSGKKSVEFVRAGQSFSSRQSNQPEDTVDL